MVATQKPPFSNHLFKIGSFLQAPRPGPGALRAACAPRRPPPASAGLVVSAAAGETKAAARGLKGTAPPPPPRNGAPASASRQPAARAGPRGEMRENAAPSPEARGPARRRGEAPRRARGGVGEGRDEALCLETRRLRPRLRTRRKTVWAAPTNYARLPGGRQARRGVPAGPSAPSFPLPARAARR